MTIQAIKKPGYHDHRETEIIRIETALSNPDLMSKEALKKYTHFFTETEPILDTLRNEQPLRYNH